MKGQMVMWRDQYGDTIWARSVKELKEKAGPGRVFKIYCDKKEGPPVQTGYGVGKRWFTGFIPFERPA